MAEVIGLAASIIQIAGAGAKLSSALYHFTTSAVRADQDITDIASDVELTSNALESVGKVFETEDAKSLVSKKAIQDANNIIKRCEAVFNDISELIDKRRKSAKDGKKGLSVIGKLAWPMKEQRVVLHRRRLDSLKNSLVLLLHVVQLAQGQALGQLEKDTLEKERDKIRELHQRQQDSLKCLQALETKLNKITLDDDVTLTGSVTTSRVPTLDLMLHNPTQDTLLSTQTSGQKGQHSNKINSTNLESDTSDSEVTTTDDEDEHLSLEEIATAAKHVQKLLKRITQLQHTFDTTGKSTSHKKRRVNKIYQRFCRKWEADVAATRPTQSNLKPDREMGRREPSIPIPGSNELQNLRVPILPLLSEPLVAGSISTGPQDDSRVRMAVPKRKKASKPRLRIDPEHVNPPAENLDSVERRPLPPPLYLMTPMEIAPGSFLSSVVDAGAISAAIDRDEQYSHSPAYSSSSGYRLRVVDDENKGSESVHGQEHGKLFHEAADTALENHAQEDPLECNHPACGKIFYRLDILRRHQALHMHGFQNDFRRDSITTDGSHFTYSSGHLPIEPTSFDDAVTPEDTAINHNDVFNNCALGLNFTNGFQQQLTPALSSNFDSGPTPQLITAGDIHENESEAKTERLEIASRRPTSTPTDTAVSEASYTRMTRSKRKRSSTIDQQELLPPKSSNSGQSATAEAPNTTLILPGRVTKGRERPAPRKRSSRHMIEEKNGLVVESPQLDAKEEVCDLDLDLDDDICMDLGHDLSSVQQDDGGISSSVPQNSASVHQVERETSSKVGSVDNGKKIHAVPRKLKRSKPTEALMLSNNPVRKKRKILPSHNADTLERDIVDMLLDQWTVAIH